MYSLLILEGATHREPATLGEVPAAEIALVARILAKCRLRRPIRHSPKYRHSADRGMKG
jgi:hypothetical protein